MKTKKKSLFMKWHGVGGFNSPPSTEHVLEMVRLKIITKEEARQLFFSLDDD